LPREARADRRSGFTLLEALVALALILAFVAVLAPNLFQSRRIMANAEGRLAAQIVLRTILTKPIKRAELPAQRGEINGTDWQLRAEPVDIPELSRSAIGGASGTPRDDKQPRWMAFRVTASVSRGPDLRMSAETIRLVKEDRHDAQ
jgi:general secretion pathway protein I